MFFKLLSNVYLLYKKLTTPRDYQIISEKMEYKINYDLKYHLEDDFWKRESKDWDGILEDFYVVPTGYDFRTTTIPENVEKIILRIKYYFNDKVYSVLSNDHTFMIESKNEESSMKFVIPLSSVWIVDHDDKPIRNITEKVRRYSGPRCDFHQQKVPLRDFLYYEPEYLKTRFPKIVMKNAIGMKKTVSTLEGYTTDLQIP
tara:strand:+ start:2411 stop:3013 length:603 start_codon:yes stop_codon:yes gene_type:complete